jgi:hypothetical protein
MRTYILTFSIVLATYGIVNAQGGDPSRGPYNILPNGVVDGIAIKDEVPVRSAVEYEFVRSADLVWSKRVFSRIDNREKLNHEIFFPNDKFEDEYEAPKSATEIDNPKWNKHAERWSLWTIISRHIMLGDLTVYRPYDELFPLVADGYKFKYPIAKNSKGDYFTVPAYRNAIHDKKIAASAPPSFYEYTGQYGTLLYFTKTDLPYQQWLDSLKNDPSDEYADIDLDKDKIKELWELVKPGERVLNKRIVKFLSSECIVAYNIKEDWFFDKERSMLDRRIIAIAPVVHAETDSSDGAIKQVFFYVNGARSAIDNSGILSPYNGTVVERELFWLYFPELRNVMVNYYVYNEQNDAQWMSFDDMFWKRRFSAQIYRVSDKFDKEIEDYKFGVDALYEAERIKEQIREWEINVWNY